MIPIIELFLLALLIWAGYGGLQLYRQISSAIEAGLRIVRETANAQTQALTHFATVHTAAITQATKAHGDVLDMIAHTHGVSAGALASSSEKLMYSVDAMHAVSTKLTAAAQKLMESSDCFDDMRRDLNDLRKWRVGDRYRQ